MDWPPRENPEQKCVRLKYVLSYSPTEGGREAEEDANPNAAPALKYKKQRAAKNTGRASIFHEMEQQQSKHPVSRGENQWRSEVHYHFQGHTFLI